MRPQPIDRAVLTRQFLTAATSGVVDKVLPHATPCNMALPPNLKQQNEPKPPQPLDQTPFVNANKPAATASSPRNRVLQDATRCNPALPTSRIGKTNPSLRQTILSTQQLAAARLLACGHAPVEVAELLRISRQTLWRWRRTADFDAEVFRLHECLIWTAGVTTGRK